MDLKAIFLGILLGVAVPATFMGLLQLGLFLFNQNLSTDIAQAGWLFGVALNAVLVRVVFKNKREFLTRGILLASFLIFIAWVVFFVVLENPNT